MNNFLKSISSIVPLFIEKATISKSEICIYTKKKEE